MQFTVHNLWSTFRLPRLSWDKGLDLNKEGARCRLSGVYLKCRLLPYSPGLDRKLRRRTNVDPHSVVGAFVSAVKQAENRLNFSSEFFANKYTNKQAFYSQSLRDSGYCCFQCLATRGPAGDIGRCRRSRVCNR